MAGFLYYLPKLIGAPKVDRLREMGLGYAFDAPSCQHRGCETGPDNEGGMVVAHPSFPKELLGFYPDRQKWRKLVGRSDPVWVGMYTEQRPTPKDLAREQLVSGIYKELEDGHQWLLPIARRFEEFGDELKWRYNLPTRLTLSDEGVWEQGGVLPRYDRLWQLAMAYEDAFFDALSTSPPSADGSVRFTFEDGDTLVVECLKANYRVDATELDLLGIYGMSLRNIASNVLLDKQTQLEWFKKKLTQDDAGLSS